MSELMIAIAIWCGPVIPTSGYTGSGSRDKAFIGTCRKRVIECVALPANNTNQKKIDNCFKVETL